MNLLFKISIYSLAIVSRCHAQEPLTFEYGDTRYMDSAHYITVTYFVLKKNLEVERVRINNYYHQGEYAIMSLKNGKLNGDFSVVFDDGRSNTDIYRNDSLLSRTMRDSAGVIWQKDDYEYIGNDTISLAISITPEASRRRNSTD